jgi:hypothetical protein
MASADSLSFSSASLRFLALLAVWMAMPAQVVAQSTFKCQSASGIYYADRPCAHDAKTAEATPTLPKPVPTPMALDTRTAFLAHLSSECRQLNDTLRALQAARPTVRSEWELHRQRVSDAVERYRGRCLEEERYALQRVSDADRQQREQQRSALVAKQAEKERAATDKAQCAEMRAIRDAKRQRLNSMTPGERSDFERFQSAYSSRCEGVVSR